MANGITGIDHGVVAVRNLDTARATYQKLGFTTTPRRRFKDWGTANYSVMFENDFIELLGVVDPHAFLTPGLEDYLVDGEGLMAVTLHTENIGAAHDQLVRGGFEPSDISETEIMVETGNGPLPQKFRWLRLAPKTTPDMYFMLVQQMTPENMRRDAWLHHPNGASAITSMTVVVDDPPGLMGAYEALFGTVSSAPTENTLAIHAGHGTLIFVTEDNFSRLHPNVASTSRERPFMAAMTLEVEDARATAAILQANGVPHIFSAEGGVRVAAEHACGVVLQFCPPT